MDLALIRECVRVAIAVAGAVSIFCGYRLFCEIPFGTSRRMNIVNGVSGAALALFGMAMLIGDIRGLSNHAAPAARQTVHHSRPAEAGSFAPSGEHRRLSEWTI